MIKNQVMKLSRERKNEMELGQDDNDLQRVRCSLENERNASLTTRPLGKDFYIKCYI